MLLKIGSKGDDVKKIQSFLGILADGDFGPKTEQKIKEWQVKNNLTPDGIIGDITWNKMFPSSAINDIIDISKLKNVIPDSVLIQIPDVCKIFNITNKLRLAHFLAQCAHESAGFKIVSENLNYSVDRMLEIFKYDFDINHDKLLSVTEKAKALALKGNAEKIANFVYANQNGNGNEASGDGWKYRGRGFIQTTGRSNYEAFDKYVTEDIISNPDLVSTKYPLASAAFYFDKNKLWDICDKGSSLDNVKAVTKRVNGGYIGIDDRIKYFNKIYNALL